jgi:hypothetical protein
VSGAHKPRPRDPYAEVGEASRAMIERAIETCEGRELPRYARTLLAAIHWTTTRSRKSDKVYLAQLTDIAKIAGDRDGKHTADALHLLDERGALTWRPSSSPGKPSWIGLPGSLPLQLPILTSVRGATSVAEGGPLSAAVEGLSGPPSEKIREVRGIVYSKALLPNESERACETCGRVESTGYVYGTLWFCERHRQDEVAA